MIKLKRINATGVELFPLKLEDLSVLKKKISEIRCLRKIRKDIDDELVRKTMHELGYGEDRLKTKRIKKVIKKILANKIQEL